MAPEVGLEPTTTRLTAACSTIELLWNRKGRKSNGARARRQFHSSSFLAVRTVKRTAGGLDQPADGMTAFHTGFAGPVVDVQAFGIVDGSAGGLPEIEEAVSLGTAEIEGYGAAAGDGFVQHLPDGGQQAGAFGQGQPAGGATRGKPGPEQAFAGVNIAHAGNEGLIKQFYFDGLTGFFKRPQKGFGVKRFGPRLGAELLDGSKVEG